MFLLTQSVSHGGEKRGLSLTPYRPHNNILSRRLYSQGKSFERFKQKKSDSSKIEGPEKERKTHVLDFHCL